jgi:hypothetical protein
MAKAPSLEDTMYLRCAVQAIKCHMYDAFNSKIPLEILVPKDKHEEWLSIRDAVPKLVQRFCVNPD